MPRVVFSLDAPLLRARLTSSEALATFTGLARLYGWDVQPALGYYEGALENSLVVDGHQLAPGSAPFEVLLALLNASGQEAVVWVDGRHTASLVYTDCSRRTMHLGVLSEVSTTEGLSAWTRTADGRLYSTF